MFVVLLLFIISFVHFHRARERGVVSGRCHASVGSSPGVFKVCIVETGVAALPFATVDVVGDVLADVSVEKDTGYIRLKSQPSTLPLISSAIAQMVRCSRFVLALSYYLSLL